MYLCWQVLFPVSLSMSHSAQGASLHPASHGPCIVCYAMGGVDFDVPAPLKMGPILSRFLSGGD